MNRRTFLASAAWTAGVWGTLHHAMAEETVEATAKPASIALNAACPIPFENTVRDRLWMWGHDSHSLDAIGNLKTRGGTIYPPEAIQQMGIPNVCMVPFTGTPRYDEYDEYAKRFANPAVKRFTWSFIHGSTTNSEQIKKAVFKLAAEYPNLVGLDMDDFFCVTDAPTADGSAPAVLKPAEVWDVQRELETTAPRRRGQKLDLSLIWYTHQLKPIARLHADAVDVVYFWTWNAKDLVNLEQNFTAYRKIAPKVRTRLGIYMWDFGGTQELPLEGMKHQLDLAYRWLMAGEIEGLIFHCTPLCDMNMEAVEFSRRWIEQHGEEKIGG